MTGLIDPETLVQAAAGAAVVETTDGAEPAPRLHPVDGTPLDESPALEIVSDFEPAGDQQQVRARLWRLGGRHGHRSGGRHSLAAN